MPGYWYIITDEGMISQSYSLMEVERELRFWASTKHKVYAFWSMFSDLE